MGERGGLAMQGSHGAPVRLQGRALAGRGLAGRENAKGRNCMHKLSDKWQIRSLRHQKCLQRRHSMRRQLLKK